MIANKLKLGDEIRVISPSRSLSIVDAINQQIAIERLKELGFKVTFGEHCFERDEFSSSSICHWSFSKEIKHHKRTIVENH